MMRTAASADTTGSRLGPWPVLGLCGALLLSAAGTLAEVVTGEEASTGRRSWEWLEDGVSLELIQLLPDQTRAFYLGRGFDAAEADYIAGTCVFQTIFRNDGKVPMSYELHEWQVVHQGERSSMLTREFWDERWQQEAGVSEAARIAIRWALLPSRQHYEAGDYNWGMSSFGLAPGSAFDLELTLEIADTRVHGTIPDIVCAADEPRP